MVQILFTVFGMGYIYENAQIIHNHGTLLGGGHRYSWILLDTGFFGYLANFWDPSIQVSKKKHVFTPNFLTLGTHRGRGLGLNSLLL